MEKYYSNGFNLRTTKILSDLAAQEGKDYFLIDADRAQDSANVYEIPQSVINDLVKDGVYTVYQAGDIKLGNEGFNDIVDAEQTWIAEGTVVDYSAAVSRLNSILNKYGYNVDQMNLKDGISNLGMSYNLDPNSGYFTALGQAIAIGTGNISNIFIPLK